MTGSYSRAFGLHSQDIDTNTEVNTQWYQFSFGLRYRILGGKKPARDWLHRRRSAMGLRLQHLAGEPTRGRRTLHAPSGRRGRPLCVGPLFGVRRRAIPTAPHDIAARRPCALGGADGARTLRWPPRSASSTSSRPSFAGSYTMIGCPLPSGMGDAVPHGTIYDQAIVFSAGATVVF